ncbi:Pecanex protein-domain-containing protein, partial [Polychytrium aggregatum]|uniref:Pecanex protein-domain-containing protein n=1 Tax=Polychytrium aggregatum TaxID=110093 RepID=UPI0022FEAC77
MSAPLLNEYTLAFALREAFATLTGGLRLPPSEISRGFAVLLVVLQFAAALAPYIVWAIFNAALSNKTTALYGFMGTIAALLAAVALADRYFLHARRARYATVGILDDASIAPSEIEDRDSGSLSYLIFQFIFQTKAQHWVFAMLRIALSALFLGLWVWSSTLSSRSQVVAGLEWIPVLMAQWSLTSGPPPEPNIFFPEDPNGIDRFTRPFHVCVAIVWGYLEQVYAVYTYSDVFFLALPLFWSTGVLPSLRLSLCLLAEKAGILILGEEPLIGGAARLLALRSLGYLLLGAVLALYLCTSSLGAVVIVAQASACILSSTVINQMMPFGLSIPRPGRTLARGLAHMAFRLALSCSLVYVQSQSVVSTHQWTAYAVYVLFGSMVVCSRLVRPYLFSVVRNPVPPQTHRILSAGFMLLHLVAPYFVALDLAPSNLPNVFSAIFLARAFRRSWQEVLPLLCELSVVRIAEAAGGSVLSTFNSLDIGLRLLISYLVVATVLGIKDRLGFATMTVFYFLTDKKQRRRGWPFYLAYLVVLAPLILALVALSAALEMPLLSFLGLPVFWVGYPRTQSQWPWEGTEAMDGHSRDAPLYVDLAPSLLAHPVIRMSLLSMRPGSTLVAKLDSRIVFIRICELWFDGVVVLVRGLELVPTSCHTVEAAGMESVFESASSGSAINRNFLHTMQPLSSVKIPTYSDSRTVATGILDNPENLRLLPATIYKTLVWIIHRNFCQEDLAAWQDFPLSKETVQSAWRRFPVKWYDFLRSESSASSLQELRHMDESMMVVAAACYSFIVHPGSPDYLTQFALYESFLGQFQELHFNPWLLEDDQRPLLQTCIRAYRCAVMLIYEQSVLGVIDDFRELSARLAVYELDYHIGVEPPSEYQVDAEPLFAEWQHQIQSKQRAIFAFSGIKDEQILIRIMNYGVQSVDLGHLNPEAIKGIWANLILELLYLTNDDEERYSIQAHKQLLRNLTIQAANPPLGYP